MIVPRSRMGRACTDRKPGVEGLGREARPAAVRGGQVLVHDRLAGAVAVEARSFLGLELEQLEQAHRLARRGHHPQLAVRGRRA